MQIGFAVGVRFGMLERVRFDVMPTVTAPRPSLSTAGQSGRATAAEADVYASEFDAAYSAAWLPVFRFALAWTNDWSAAEDLAQEAFLRLWNQRTKVDWSVSVVPWLLVTTRRNATDRFRRLRRALAVRGPVEVTPGSDARIEWLDLQSSFKDLSALERTALVLTALEDLSAVEAGEILGIGANAVRSAASRGRRKLKEQR
jgi:RNA polymerase sigma-70 factor (ECF subfamily)